MKKTLSLAAIAAALAVGATDYFVDIDAGSDNAAGTSPATAWKTLARTAMKDDVKPGDVVRLKRGGIWRESLLPVSGEPGRPVTYTWYGKGPKPIIQRSLDRSRPEDWEPVGKKAGAKMQKSAEKSIEKSDEYLEKTAPKCKCKCTCGENCKCDENQSCK